MCDFNIENYNDFYYIVSYKNENNQYKISKNELEKIEHIENISLFMKIYIQKDKYERWIVLFTNDTPTLVNNKRTYYYMTKEKSMNDYQYNIFDNNEDTIIQYILDKNPL